MSWERDPLWAKARLFFERALDEPRDAPTFGLWASLGLELLARSALATISPTLLAEADREHRHLLYALSRGSGKVPPKSITAAQVFGLCEELIPDFTDHDSLAAMALMNRRNEELHTGGAAFDEYPSSLWLTGLYRACRSLCASMDESLESLLGKDEAIFANEVLAESQDKVKKTVLDEISKYGKLFLKKTQEQQDDAKAEAQRLGLQQATQRRHRVACPACGCVATVQGRLLGKENVSHEDGMIVVRQAVAPREFACSACGLELEGYAQLAEAGVGGHYQRRTTYTPEEYYGLGELDEDGLSTNEQRERMVEYDNE